MSIVGNFSNLRSHHNAPPALSKIYLRGVSRVNVFHNIDTNTYNVLHRGRTAVLLPHSLQSNKTHAAAGEITSTSVPLQEQIASLSTAQHILEILEHTPLTDLMTAAAALRDQGHPSTITFSPKVFIPLTRLCRDTCGYCTFAQGPVPGHRVYMTLEEVLTVARMGAEQGCTEALFTLG